MSLSPLDRAKVQAGMWAEYCRQWGDLVGRGSAAVGSFWTSLGEVRKDMHSGTFQYVSSVALDTLGVPRKCAP